MLATVNCLNVRTAMNVMVFLIAAKVLSLAIIVIGGVVLLVQGNSIKFENPFKWDKAGCERHWHSFLSVALVL